MNPNIPYKGGAEVILTCGSTDGMYKVLDVFTNVWVAGKHDIRERPGLLSDVFMYGSVISQAEPRGIQVVGVEMDGAGMAVEGPGGLEDVLASWDDSKGKRPHLMYTVTYVETEISHSDHPAYSRTFLLCVSLTFRQDGSQPHKWCSLS